MPPRDDIMRAIAAVAAVAAAPPFRITAAARHAFEYQPPKIYFAASSRLIPVTPSEETTPVAIYDIRRRDADDI